MLTKRIIPCLDIKDGRTVKGVNFVGLRDAGDPVLLAEKYSEGGADELVFLDISASADKRKTLIDLVENVARKTNIPFTVGGGIRTVKDVYQVLRAGADKISINSAAVKNPKIINELSNVFGNQCITVAIDAKPINGDWKVHLVGGRIATAIDLFEWSKEVEDRGAGEILFTSMKNDGTKNGFAIDALKRVSEIVQIPVIASGGAGSTEDFIDVFHKTEVSAALAASVFHYEEIKILDLKNILKNNKIEVRI